MDLLARTRRGSERDAPILGRLGIPLNRADVPTHLFQQRKDSGQFAFDVEVQIRRELSDHKRVMVSDQPENATATLQYFSEWLDLAFTGVS